MLIAGKSQRGEGLHARHHLQPQSFLSGGYGVYLEEIKRLTVGPMATVPTPFDDDFEVDEGV